MTRNGFSGIFIIPMLLFFLSGPVSAEQKVDKDLDGDGKIDQVQVYDTAGNLLRLESDKNQDGFFEIRQLYQDGKLTRIERDTDNDRKMDSIDHIEADKRVRQERLDKDGHTTQVSYFDAAEQLREIRKDSTGDLRFDTVYHFTDGVLTSSTKDSDANGKPNIWCTYRNQLPVEQRIDEDEDGIMDRILFFDAAGELEKMLKEPLGTDRYKVTLHFKNNAVQSQHKDADGDGKADDITLFQNEQPVEQKKDTNFDGRFDVVTRFVKGVCKTQEKDTNHDGQPDFFAEFDDKGLLLKTREDTRGDGKDDRIRHYRAGNLYRVEHDHDGDDFFETVSLFEKGKMVQNLIDRNKDGQPDVTILFDEKEEKKSLVSDSNLDGRIDTWQYYAANQLTRFEKDENGDGRPDIRIVYDKGRKTTMHQDADFDGHFETTQVYDDPVWTSIVSRDINKDKRADIISYYTDDILMRREMDEDGDGVLDAAETYHPDGRLAAVEEKSEGRTVLTWFYDDAERVVRAEEDKNRDGAVDIWYLYDKGVLTTVREDTNLDGKPDLWEVYDETQAIVKREKDLDFDGTPDFVDIVEDAEDIAELDS